MGLSIAYLLLNATTTNSGLDDLRSLIAIETILQGPLSRCQGDGKARVGAVALLSALGYERDNRERSQLKKFKKPVILQQSSLYPAVLPVTMPATLLRHQSARQRVQVSSSMIAHMMNYIQCVTACAAS